MNLLMNLLAILSLISSIALSLYLAFIFYKKWIYSYWKRKGLEYALPDEKPDLYKKAKAKGVKHIGGFMMMSPVYYPIDLDLIKNIVVKDFDHFVNRGGYSNPKVDPLGSGLLSLQDEQWKKARTKLTPTFTSGKMKMMFHTMVESFNGLMRILEEHADTNKPIEASQTMATYTVDVIGSVAFGLDCNTINDPDSEFRKFTQGDDKVSWRLLLSIFGNPRLLKLINFRPTDQKTIDYFLNLTKNMVQYREANNVTRKDFLQLLIQLRDQVEVRDGKSEPFFTFNDIASHCFTFFSAGFSTSSSTLSVGLLEIALHQDIQDKVRKEVKETLAKYGEMSYDAIMSMEYLDKVVSETLRKYPVAKALLRSVTKRYHVPGTDLVLEPGEKVHVSVLGIHRDPDHYPDPLKFDPERFSPENKSGRHPMAYLPFGEGPRMCIGFRFALLQMKVGIATLLDRFRITVNEKTSLPVEIDETKGLIAVKGGSWLNVHRL